jgi:uncharacterized membrane protein
LRPADAGGGPTKVRCDVANNVKWSDERIRRIAGALLRTGVLAAALIVAVGGAIYLARHGHEKTSLAVFRNEPREYKTVGGILTNAETFHGRGLIQLGLLVLIATPVAQVAMSVLGFARERDFRYVVIGLIVLAFLAYGLLDGRV